MSDQQAASEAKEKPDRSPELAELVKAMCAARLEFKPLHFNQENPAFKRDGKPSRYADLAACMEAAEPALNKHGLMSLQVVTTSQGFASCVTEIHHTSGQWLAKGRVTIPALAHTAHAYGAAITYAKRQSYVASHNLSAEADDDGNAASGVSPQAAYAQSQQVARKPAPKPSAPADVPDDNVKIPPAMGEFRTGIIWQFGRLKGKDLAEFTTKELSSSFDYLLAQSADPAKAKFKEKNDELAAKVMDEIERREVKK